MIPAAFDYHRPSTLDEAVGLLGRHGDEAKVLAGGHSLLPALKLRLAQPKVVIDIGRIKDLSFIREQDGRISIGAMTTHHQIESYDLLRAQCPLLPETASTIGDPQVRNRGTIGGSLAHADPAADWPAAVLALDAEIEIVGPKGRRSVRAKDFFVDMFQTALRPGEILSAIRVAPTSRSVAYQKFAQKASGFAIVGVAVVIDQAKSCVNVGITGVAPKAYRAAGVEEGLRGKPLTPETVASASARAANGVDPLGDIHASADFRAHLARVHTRRAIETAARRGA